MNYRATISLTLLPLVLVSGRLFSDEAKDKAELELMKKVEIERMKARIMQELGLSEIPVAKTPSKQFSDTVIQLLLADGKPPVRDDRNLARLVIFPSNDDFQCRHNSSSSCQRFQFLISPGVQYSTAEFWYLPSLTFDKPTITVWCTHAGEDYEQVVVQDTLHSGVLQYQWTSFHLTGLKQLTLWKEDLTCAVEVENVAVSEHGSSLPFIKVIKDMDAHFRNKRSVNKTAEQIDTCKTISFVVAFEDIGFHTIYPKSYEAKLCRGYCVEARTMHEAVLDMTFRRDSALEREHGRCWSTCCKPKMFSPLRLIYEDGERNGTEVVIDKYIQDMVVESCWCN